MEIRGLTLWQPMAWAIAAGHKPYENRPWQPHRGVTHLAIHAGKKYHQPHVDQIRELGIDVPAKADLAFGAVLCVAELRWWRPFGGGAGWASPWASGPFVRRVQPVWVADDPIPCSGALGMWRIPGDVKAEMRRQGFTA